MRSLRPASVACLIGVSGCGNTEANLERLLAAILPPSLMADVTASCTPFMGPAVGLFTISAPQADASPKDDLGAHAPGHWTRAASLSDFASAEDADYPGLGVGATILDGKECYRFLGEPGALLSGPQPGMYFRSDPHDVVVIIFESPANQGVIFVQAP